MYKDLIHYQLAEGITEEHLLEVAAEVVRHWMKKLPGFISWEICRSGNGKYTDIVCWESPEHAKNAEKDMAKAPGFGKWVACYAPGSIKSDPLQRIAQF